MRQLLSTVLAGHWAAVFGILAFLCASEPRAGAAGVLQVFGQAEAAGVPLGGVRTAAVLALGFAVAASLFLWMLSECVFGHGDADGAGGSGDRAFAGGFLALGLLGLAALLESSAGQAFVAVECLAAVVLASFLAARAERLLPAGSAGGDGMVRAAHEMALEAAHHTMLSQIAGRAGDAPAGRN